MIKLHLYLYIKIIRSNASRPYAPRVPDKPSRNVIKNIFIIQCNGLRNFSFICVIRSCIVANFKTLSSREVPRRFLFPCECP